MKQTSKILAIYCLNLFFSPYIQAEQKIEAEEPDEDMSEMMELMDILEEETSIATKSKANSDYVPGMVTVLNGEEMLALGKRTVWDALSQVPGIKTLKSNGGSPLLVVRGVPFPFNTGNIKIMVNSTTMSSEVSGINSSILLMSIEQVERIEFIRGPSSSIYGNSAYMGLVNIITYKNNKLAHINGYDGHFEGAGGQYFWEAPDQALRFSANISMTRDHDAIAKVGTQAEEDKDSLIFTLDYQNTSLTAQWYERDYLHDNNLPITNLNSERTASITINHKVNLSENLDSEIKLSLLDTDFDANKIYQSFATNTQVDFNWQANEQHKVLFGLAFKHYNIDQATLCISDTTPLIGEPGFIPGVTPSPSPNSCARTLNNPTPPGANPPQIGEPSISVVPQQPPPRLISNKFLRDESWNEYSFSIQDQYALTADLTLTAGFAINRNSNLHETNISPRLAFVWQMAEAHLLKGQYAKGFRSPTYFELYDLQARKADLESEQVDSYELGYIYRHNNLLGRVTLFHSKLSNLIHPNERETPNNEESNNYTSTLKAKTTGIELEWEQKINQYLKWSFNLSYADSKDTRNDTESFQTPPSTSSWLGNLNLFVQTRDNILLTAHYYYVGKQYIRSENTDKYIEGNQILDLTANFSRLFHKRLTLRLGIKNVFDDEVLYFDTQPSTTEANEFPGRTWWAQLSYRL